MKGSHCSSDVTCKGDASVALSETRVHACQKARYSLPLLGLGMSGELHQMRQGRLLKGYKSNLYPRTCPGTSRPS